MKNHTVPTIITLQGVKHIRLVSVCAWCPKSIYPQLSKNEEYTHGICDSHLKQVTREHRLKRQHALSV